MVTGIELTKMQTAAVLIEPLDVLVKPDILATDGRNSLGLQLNLLDRVFRYKITS
jgi:hypothetical protein